MIEICPFAWECEFWVFSSVDFPVSDTILYIITCVRGCWNFLIHHFILDFTSRAGWPRRHFCGWSIRVMCNYHALKHLMWRGHHFPADRDPVRSNRERKRTLETPFWTAKMALSKGKREIPGPKMDLKTCGRTPDERRTNTHDFLNVSTQKPLRGKKHRYNLIG